MKKLTSTVLAAVILVVTMAAAASADTWDKCWKPDGNKHVNTIIYR